MSKRNMTKATPVSSYEQVVSLQDRLVLRGILERREHDTAADSYSTVRDTVCIHCTCGEWLQYPAEGSERLYVGHVTTSLRARLAVAA